MCDVLCTDGPRCHGGETVAGRVHAAENGNPHSLEETWREGEEHSQQRCDVFPQVRGDSEARAHESTPLILVSCHSADRPVATTG